MRNKPEALIRAIALSLTLVFTCSFAQDEQAFYSKHKNDEGMEARIVPPKMASLLLEEEEYPEAKDLLKSLRSLKYLNYWGDQDRITNYASSAIQAIDGHEHLYTHDENGRTVTVYGTKKRGMIRKALIVVKTKAQFIMLIAKGKVSEKQLANIPEISEEIQ